MVDQFLRAQRLTQRDTLIDFPRPSAPMPDGLGDDGRAAFLSCLDSAPNDWV